MLPANVFAVVLAAATVAVIAELVSIILLCIIICF